ncbi:MAG: histidine kinase, partial [Flavisolibacter sp.]|nr:histidine kinase [Flavisolibacter sp.]
MRKSLLLICCLFFAAVRLYAQNAMDTLIHIQQIPKGGILLDKGWKFQAGDNPEWAKPQYNDKDWQVINLNQSAAQFLRISKGNLIWLRLDFAVGASIQDSLMALLIEQFGASEIYLDGQLVKRFGTITSAKEFSAFNPHGKPVAIELNKMSSHVLAVRFAPALPTSKWVLQRSTTAPLSVRLQALSDAMAGREAMLKASRFRVGVFYIYALFGFLFLLLFLFYPRQRLNLYYSLFNILLVINAFVSGILNEGQYGLTEGVYFSYVVGIVSRLIGINILLFMLYALFNRIKPVFFWFIVIVFIDFPLSVLLPAPYMFISNGTRILFILVILWIAVQALRSKNKEDWLIGLLASAVVFVNASFALRDFTGIDIMAYATLTVPVVITLSMVTYLALRYARANRSLEQRLVEVKKLSEQTVAQEQEKQQILAAQKDTLEKQVNERTAQLKQSLEELKSTQAQLVQREKMASLGELTAGIAHEIQNPLNFVNNFSEVSTELIDELKTGVLQKLPTEDKQEAESITNDLSDNLQKIIHHGKRADAIVKGMLQHSRSSTGQKELTDINSLADECLRLSFHGMRAKEKAFNARLETQFDPAIEKVNVAPQDLGRVLLNLFNNAFYAVWEKKKQLGDGYEPVVTVKTKKIQTSSGSGVEITICDNGLGIPQKVMDKIFQPFFTTKPTGEGTGLGLS